MGYGGENGRREEEGREKRGRSCLSRRADTQSNNHFHNLINESLKTKGPIVEANVGNLRLKQN